jgi:hypothetical protein
MAELKLSGNHLKGSRSVLSFDQSFDTEPHLMLIKEVLAQVGGNPRGLGGGGGRGGRPWTHARQQLAPHGGPT